MSARRPRSGKQRAAHAPAPRPAEAQKPVPAEEQTAHARQPGEAATPRGNQLLQKAMAPRAVTAHPPAGGSEAASTNRQLPAARAARPQRRPAPAHQPAPVAPDEHVVIDTNQRDALELAVNGRAQAHAPRTSLDRIVIADEARAVAPGQMRKTEFLAALEIDVTEAAERELTPAGRSIGDCPWIPHWFSYYQQRDVAQIERALVKFAPEAAGARSVGAAIDAVRNRVVRSVRQSLALGRPVDTPAGMPAGAFDPDAPTLPSVGAPTTDPILNESSSTAGTTQREGLGLGAGQPLDAASRARMESAFGADLSHVRVHSDARGQTAAGRAGARAFAYGGDVAFAPGQHRPGTLVGDALLAHELAHTLQQQAERSHRTLDSQSLRGAATTAIETDADASAHGAVTRLWGGVLGLNTAGVRARPALRGGLQVARCGGGTPGELQPDTSVGPRRTVDVKQFKAEGTSPNPTRDIAFANTRVYPQANLGINALPEETLTAAETRTLLGEDAKVSERTEDSAPTDDEQRLFARFASTTVINVIYVRDFTKDSCRGTATTGLGYASGMAVIKQNTRAQAFSHEIGHVMGLEHRDRSDNLMHPGGADDSKVRLQPDQVTTVRNSSYAR